MSHDSNAVPPANLENRLARLLDELTQVQEEMLDVLAAKRDRMADGDLVGMSELQPRVEALCTRLQTCHQQRGELLAEAAQQGHHVENLGELAKTLPLPQPGKMVSQVKDAAERVRLMQLHSLTNWVLAQRSLLHVSQLLEIIATGGQLQPTYGRGQSPTSQGTLVDQEA